MTDSKNNLLINYNLLTINAMRNVVINVLKDVANNGLPKNHHFYITFDTNYKNIEIPNILKKKYPNEMTIVIENSFWEFLVKDNYFSIVLSFADIKTTLVVPFESLILFSDPYANFHLKFPKLEYNKEINNKELFNSKKKIINMTDFKKDK